MPHCSTSIVGATAAAKGRIKNVCEQLEEIGLDPLGGVEGIDSPADIEELAGRRG
jgi:hypothetical protein